MGHEDGYTELVVQARRGDRQSLERLAECVRAPLYAYVYRIVLREDLAQDTVQETMLEMFRVLGKLNKVDRFWPWLCKIALNKVRLHHRQTDQQRRAMRQRADLQGAVDAPSEGLEQLVTEEFKEIVRAAMNGLMPMQRAVLSMRCYENMSYAQIAEILDSSELSARLTFYRAKKRLQRLLSRQGLGRGAMLGALVLFGKMTAPSQAAAAGVSVTNATVQVGSVATAIGLLTAKTTVATVVTVGLIAGGVVLTERALDETPSTPPAAAQASGSAVVETAQPGHVHENWFYFPAGVDGPVMSKMITREKNTGLAYCQWLQSDSANYYYDAQAGIVYLSNHRHFNEDLSVQRLPTDSPALTDFLNRVEGTSSAAPRSIADGPQLLVVMSEQDGVFDVERVVHGYDVLHEEHFQYNWPAGARKVDRLDGVHRQGYALVRLSGWLGQAIIEGEGVLPLTYQASQTIPAWLHVRVGSTTVLGGPGATFITDSRQRSTGAYPAGHVFAGIGRPWEGLHAIDVIRRDAARYQIPFTTQYLEDRSRVQIDLRHTAGTVRCVVSLDSDWLESVVFLDGQEQIMGRMDLTYHETLDDRPDPSVLARTRPAVIGEPDSLWLIRLAQGHLSR